APERLVEEEARVRQGEALLARGGDEEERRGARHPARSDHPDRRVDEADHVVDRVARLDVTAGRVDEDADRLARPRVEGEELCGERVRELAGDLAEEEDGAAAEERLARLVRDGRRGGGRGSGRRVEVRGHGRTLRRAANDAMAGARRDMPRRLVLRAT